MRNVNITPTVCQTNDRFNENIIGSCCATMHNIFKQLTDSHYRTKFKPVIIIPCHVCLQYSVPEKYVINFWKIAYDARFNKISANTVSRSRSRNLIFSTSLLCLVVFCIIFLSWEFLVNESVQRTPFYLHFARTLLNRIHTQSARSLCARFFVRKELETTFIFILMRFSSSTIVIVALSMLCDVQFGILK